MSFVPVIIVTDDGREWTVNDTSDGVDVEHVKAQVQKATWIPVFNRDRAGYVRAARVVAVFPERAQP